jgi:hypothetical protein
MDNYESASVSVKGFYAPCPHCHQPLFIVNCVVTPPSGGINIKKDPGPDGTIWITPHRRGCVGEAPITSPSMS